MEGWCHFPSERDRLLRLLQRTPGAILLSGDVHYAEILDASSSIVTEVTSSGLTHVCTKHIYGAICHPLLSTFTAHRSNPNAGYYIGRNYGSLAIDWDAGNVQVKIHDAVTGETVLDTQPLEIVGKLPRAMSEQELRDVPKCMDGHLVPIVAAMLAGLLLLLLIWRRR